MLYVDQKLINKGNRRALPKLLNLPKSSIRVLGDDVQETRDAAKHIIEPPDIVVLDQHLLLSEMLSTLTLTSTDCTILLKDTNFTNNSASSAADSTIGGTGTPSTAELAEAQVRSAHGHPTRPSYWTFACCRYSRCPRRVTTHIFPSLLASTHLNAASTMEAVPVAVVDR